jgi:hypothetical protein
MNFIEIAELYSLHLSEKEKRILSVIFGHIIIELEIHGEPLNSSIENLKSISSLSDEIISSIVSFLKSLEGAAEEEYIFKETLYIIRDVSKIDYTYMTEPVITPTRTETVVESVDLTKFASLPPQPFPSWVLSNDTSKWIPPVEYPDVTGKSLNITYIWNEDRLQFDRKPPETPQPFPSWVPNETSTDWIPPKAYPDGTGEGYNILYSWNEGELTWQDILV